MELELLLYQLLPVSLAAAACVFLKQYHTVNQRYNVITRTRTRFTSGRSPRLYTRL